MTKARFNKLSEIADVIDSLHKTPKYSETGRAMIRCTDVKYGRLDLSKTFKVDEEIFAEFSRRYAPQRGNIIITRVGSYGITAIVEDIDFCLGQNTSVIVPKINSRYLYLALNSPSVKNQIEFSVVGSTQKTLSLKAINNLDIQRFEPEVEDRIAKIVGELDDKIELNTQTNQTLEAIAQAIFKSWFVDFEPVKAKMAVLEAGGTAEEAERAAMCAISGKDEAALTQLQTEQPDAYAELVQTAALFPSAMQDSELGEIPEGWKLSEIGNEVGVVGGGTPSTKNAEFWDDGTIHWTTPKDLSNLPDKILVNTERKITQAGLKTISSGLLPIDTVLMSSRAPVGYLALAKVPLAINQGYIAMKCNQVLTPEYVIQWCSSTMDEIKNRASGTTFAEISKKNFNNINVVVPSSGVLAKYSDKVSLIYKEIESFVIESKELSELRDTLLPKLLSGEIDLSQATDAADEVGL